MMQAGASYLVLCQNMTMKDALAPASLQPKYPNIVPCGHLNSTNEENVVKKRSCAYCQLLNNSKEGHQKLYNHRPKFPATTVQQKQTTDVSETCEAERPIRPSKIKVQRGVKLLCLTETHNLEWRYMSEWAGCTR